MEKAKGLKVESWCMFYYEQMGENWLLKGIYRMLQGFHR